MSFYQGNDLRKPTGGLKGKHRKRRKHELGSPPTKTVLANEEEKKIERTLGGNAKTKLKKATYINVALSDGTAKRVRILDVVETPENPQNARSKIISKGSVVKTELGLVKVTSRPGQDGVLNGVLLQKT